MVATLSMISARWWRKTGDWDTYRACTPSRLADVETQSLRCVTWQRAGTCPLGLNRRKITVHLTARTPESPISRSVVRGDQDTNSHERGCRLLEQFQPLAHNSGIARHQESGHIATRTRETLHQPQRYRVV